MESNSTRRKKKIADKGATERFICENVEHQNGACLIWPYGRNKSNYGLATIAGKQTLASRWMCILAHGEPPSERHEAAHDCGNPPCVNPRHLRWDTPRGNQADKLKHGTLNHGERNGKTVFSTQDVEFIRSCKLSDRELAARFGVSRECIRRIKRRERWIHTP
jgi:hypothetical protein